MDQVLRKSSLRPHCLAPKELLYKNEKSGHNWTQIRTTDFPHAVHCCSVEGTKRCSPMTKDCDVHLFCGKHLLSAETNGAASCWSRQFGGGREGSSVAWINDPTDPSDKPSRQYTEEICPCS